MSVTLEQLTALCKRRGFIYQTAEVYGGLNGIYDYGHLGTLLKQNIRSLWQKSIKKNNHEQILLLEGALLGPESTWKASGHVKNFHDPMVDCTSCKHRFRADHINLEKPCNNCGNKAWTEVRQFNMMFKTQLGSVAQNSSVAYLRPETAQSIFTNFKNIMSTNRVKIPFGVAQIGKAFRNEITPKQFLFRMREFEQMELEWFCSEKESAHYFEFWQNKRLDFFKTIGINENKLKLRPHDKNELSHYSVACTDVEYNFPFGWQELEGIANRGNYDLSQHSQHSKKDLSIFDEKTKSSFIPHVIECSIGLDRLFLTLLFDAYKQEEINGQTRTLLQFNPKIAPIKAAFLPLTKKQIEETNKIFNACFDKNLEVQIDVSGSIGKRYRRQDEIGTPLCFTYDFDSDTDKSVTVRHRDTMTQKRISIDKVESYITDFLTRK